jgi:hypothetical protein
VGERRGGGQGEEMARTIYVHMNKCINKLNIRIYIYTHIYVQLSFMHKYFFSLYFKLLRIKFLFSI